MPALFRFALAAALVSRTFISSIQAGEPVFLEQGWKDDERQGYYYLAQGSEIMPYKWFLALEEPLQEQLFRSNRNLEALRFIPNPKSKANPDGLPVGFAKGKGKDGTELFGLTCAACHTGELNFRGKTLRIDGGTTLADIIGFQTQLVFSLRATLRSDAKFDRFAARVLDKNTAEHRENLRTKMEAQLKQMAHWEATSRPAHPTGFGVWDALNILVNSTNANAISVPDNFRVPQAPVSFPSIWLTNTRDSLLWNASVENVMLRQIGEVIIVFGRAEVAATPQGLRFESSADLRDLEKVYGHVSKLCPPKWPQEVLGKIDIQKATRGQAVYMAQKCADCHPLRPYPMTAPDANGRRYVKVTRTPIKDVGTDPVYAEYFVQRTSIPGILAPMFKGTMFEKEATMPAAILFLANLTEITKAELAKFPVAEQQKMLAGRPLPSLPRNPDELNKLVSSLLVYKATSLEGIWSTAPYLHNGSVPNLYELLLPSGKRSKSFHLGQREFDPERVGYETKSGPGLYKYDATLRGFSNAGHEYGAKISDDDRWALIEFLKTL